jgi:hypothetical protein
MRSGFAALCLCAMMACETSRPPVDAQVADVASMDVSALDVAGADRPELDTPSSDLPVVPPADAVDAQGTDASRPTPCLSRPEELARPPASVLPCELIPPSFKAVHGGGLLPGPRARPLQRASSVADAVEGHVTCILVEQEDHPTLHRSRI